MKPIDRAVWLTDWVLRITGLVGIVSFSENLKTVGALLNGFWSMITGVPWLSVLVWPLETINSIYQWVSDFLFGWIHPESLRDPFMIVSSMLGLILIRALIFRKFPAFQLGLMFGAISIIFLGDYYATLLLQSGLSGLSQIPATHLMSQMLAIAIAGFLSPMLILISRGAVQDDLDVDDVGYRIVDLALATFFFMMLSVIWSLAVTIDSN